MIKQIMASALLLGNVQNAPVQNTSNITNIDYSYNVGGSPTETSGIESIDPGTTIYKKEKIDSNTYVYSKTTQLNFITKPQWDNTKVAYPVMYSQNNYVNTLVSQTKTFLYVELQQALDNNIGSNKLSTDLRSTTIQMEPTTYIGWNPYFDYKAYYMFDNTELEDIINQSFTTMNSNTMLEDIMNIYNKTQILNEFYTPTVNTYDQVEDQRNISNWNIPIFANKKTQLIIIITPIFKGNETTFNQINLVASNLTYTYDYTWHGITLNGTAQVVNNNIEVIDMPNVMWQILTMPFTFISVAFNLTLWPGTPYSVDIGSLILALLGIMIFIFIMKIIMKAAAKG